MLVMQRVMVTILTIKVTDDIATEKLGVSYTNFVNNIERLPEARLVIALVM
jgi:hypothetical protein